MPSDKDLLTAVNYALPKARKIASYPCYNWVYSGSNLYSSNWNTSCHGKLSCMQNPAVYINRIQKANLVSDELLSRFYDFLYGPESPYIEYKDELFPDEEVLVAGHSINSKEFRIEHAHIVYKFDITPAQVFISFFKMLRLPVEYPNSLLMWARLVDAGVHIRAALLYSMYWCQIQDDLVLVNPNNFTFHSWLHGYYPEETLQTLVTRKFNQSVMKKSFKYNNDWYNTDLIWHKSNPNKANAVADVISWKTTLENMCERVGKSYTDPFTGQEVYLDNLPMKLDSFIAVVKSDVERYLK